MEKNSWASMISLVYRESRMKMKATFFPQRTPTPPQLTVMVFAFCFDPADTSAQSFPNDSKGLNSRVSTGIG